MSRALGLGVLAVALLAAGAQPVRANAALPSRRVPPQPDPPQPLKVLPDGTAVPDQFPPDMKPRRTGPFRSCGSGLGTGLAGIGVAWGLMWLGTRAAGRVRGAKPQR